MSESPSSIRWVRAQHTRSALRTDGVAVVFDQNQWIALSQGEFYVLRVPSLAQNLDRAVEMADEMFPPAPWSVSSGVWSADVWQVHPNGDGTWGVFRDLEGTLEQASTQSFPSADRARRWAELRFDRGGARLRGPKPRAGSKAAFKLPDVRVTEEEKVHAMGILGDLNLGYSDFVRAALLWAQTHVLTDGGGWRVEKVEGGGYVFVSDTSS